ncbi:MAG: L-2-amino-thiazoline-4-carboxylic acid hydrolase [Dehalococcoidia bacterium]
MADTPDWQTGVAMSEETAARPDGPIETRRLPISLLQRRGIEAEVLIPLVRRLERELGRERAHAIARETIEEIARTQGHAVAEALGRSDLEGFREVKETWSGAGGDLDIETLREDGEALEFNVVGCRFAEMYRQLGATDLGFLLSCSRDFALSEGYSHDLRLDRTRTIMQGAPSCDFRYRLAASADGRSPDVTQG